MFPEAFVGIAWHSGATAKRCKHIRLIMFDFLGERSLPIQKLSTVASLWRGGTFHVPGTRSCMLVLECHAWSTLGLCVAVLTLTVEVFERLKKVEIENAALGA